MNEKKDRQLLNILVLAVSLLFASCFGTDHRYAAPEKPKDVPDDAFWVGGADGGNWYLIESVDKLAKQAAIDIFNDQNGELLVSKVFKLDCINEDSIHWNYLRDQIMFFDGNKIVLEIKGRWNSRRYCYFE